MDGILNITTPSGKRLQVRLVTTRRNGDWLAAAELNTPLGPIRLTAVASEAMVQAALARMQQRPVVGGFFDDIGATIKKFARSAAVRNVLGQVQRVLQNPMLQRVASLYPPAGIALGEINKGISAANAAANVLTRARSGDKTAQQAIITTATRAKAGDPNANLLHGLFQGIFNQMGGLSPVAQSKTNEPPMSVGASLETTDGDLLAWLRTVRAT